MRYFCILTAYLLFTVGFAACRPAESTPLAPPDGESVPGSTQTQTPNTQAESVNPSLTPKDTAMVPAITPDAAVQKMVDLAKGDLAQRLGIPIDQIALVEVRPTVWRDASLGCPQPAIDYIPMETPGYKIVLEAGGQTYNYHTDDDRRFVLCNRS
ncbi:MAG TPA: hypothetical protein VFO91_17675 [Anaerolineales bacterium]|nr:hypothetical protein [Anaerolineales bacterium]